jgi:type VI secretion system protein ImpJ
MSWNSKVVWSEGMFLQPHHLQQHDRYIENLIEQRCAHLRPLSWGITKIQIDEHLLSLGKFSLQSCEGIFPDGTPFRFPADNEPPAPLEVPENVKDAIVYLALPSRRLGMAEADRAHEPHSLARYLLKEIEVQDSNVVGANTSVSIQTGQLRLRALLESEERSAYVCLGLARIAEKQADATVILDRAFIPPCLDCKASLKLAGFISELVGLLQHRGEELALRIAEPSSRGVAEIADFLLLQVINRFEPLFIHLTMIAGLHPESLYRMLLQLAGELTTFTRSEKRPLSFPLYRHEALEETFAPLMIELRRSLGYITQPSAIRIPLQEHRDGILVASLPDPGLLKTALLVLAVRAEVPSEVLRRHFPAQVKIGPAQKMADLIYRLLPGVRLDELPDVPRQIPYHAGFTYFQLDRTDELWKEVESSAGIALHVAGDFPGLQLALWAVRE